MKYSTIISRLKESGNFRAVPSEDPTLGVIDLSSNDYLGIAADSGLRRQFMHEIAERDIPFSASASRLLAAAQSEYQVLERLLSSLYEGREALLFNSGYHANVGLVQALASDGDTLIVADKLVHASIIDGIMLSKAPFERFRHNDYDHLSAILSRRAAGYDRVLIITESVFSMDGDYADIDLLADIRNRYDNAMLYVDEAHAFGVCGPAGLGCVCGSAHSGAVDVIVGTFGKAAASVGAFCAVSPEVRDIAVNRARSFIFSTALPPVNIAWTRFVVERLGSMGDRRARLAQLSRLLADAIPSGGMPSHIRPLITGNPAKAVSLSARLLDVGFKVLPIRTPTVPPGTERLRFSLSACIAEDDIHRLASILRTLTC